MANRMGISFGQIIPLTENGESLFKNLAKLMGQIKWKEIEKCEKATNDLKINYAYEAPNKKEYEILEIILSTIEVSTNVLTKEEMDNIYQHYSNPKLNDAPGLIKLKFPIQLRYKYEDTIEMEIEKVSEFALEEVESRRFSDAVENGGFSWKIMAEIRTRNENNAKWLAVFLEYAGPEKASPNKIIQINELMDPSKGIYNKDEDKLKLAIDVIVDAPKADIFVSNPNKSNGTLSMEIEKLSEFAREVFGERKSETVYIKGMPWKIVAYIATEYESTDKCLTIYLLFDVSEEDGNWSRKCSATFRIVSQKSDVEDMKEEL
ncbi:hypothetical protein niasHT_006154 [Heterodera trifolii]|uniref:MATH domain-containing protein n=1 Tax=Heterodera trifolii TaxID=157864 RepID=A0ABD2M2V5_9BILA